VAKRSLAPAAPEQRLVANPIASSAAPGRGKRSAAAALPDGR